MWITSEIENTLKPTALALGNFDGIHRGHQQVLQPILDKSGLIFGDRAIDVENVRSTVVSFTPHPREFFTGVQLKLLTPLQEKVKQLEILGIEQLVLLPFDRQLAALTPQQFVAEILVKQLQAHRISVGEDFHFGNQRAGTAKDLQAIASGFGIEVCIVSLKKNQCQEKVEARTSEVAKAGKSEIASDLFTRRSDLPCRAVRISSSLIRQALEEGQIDRANQMLGRAYSLNGKVIKGQQIGRTIGFPTANLQVPENKFLPRFGVYAVSVAIENESSNRSRDRCFIPAVMNIGCRPTVDGNSPTIEIHLLDWSGDLYDRTLTVYLQQFIRSERKFSSLDALKEQIARDCDIAKKKLIDRVL